MSNIARLFVLTTLIFSPAKALVLENLITSGALESTLSDKRVGYYVGSFDPLHLGHEEVASLSVNKGFCDYVLIYPAWGGDSYKQRINIALRHDMVFSAFADHPTIIVTRLAPQEMQRHLTKVTDKKNARGKTLVEPAFPGLTFIGIVGSDTAMAIANAPDSLRAFMRGIRVSDKYHNHTIGGLMALPAQSFIVSMRSGDDISSLENNIADRPITEVFTSDNERGLSSTQIRKNIQAGDSIDTMVSPGILKIIEEQGLYQG